jgi:microcystin-dependent protein
MSCSNCFNGCAEIVSDKCVRYTGINVPVLGIETGDSLSYVEQALIEFLTSTLNGTGIIPIVDPTIICEAVTAKLPTCGDLTLNAYISALIEIACDIQDQVSAIDVELATLNANYTIDCLEGVASNDGTHDVLQAVINKLCALEIDITALALDLDTNYVKISELDVLIQAYLDSLPASSLQSSKMIPYAAVEYYGSLSYFDATGAGLGDWDKIYLCNGLNGTPDKRGRVPVGAIVAVPGGALNSIVNPAVAGNPNYAVGDAIYGANTVTLSASQIPAHTHAATVTDTHYHFLATNESTGTTSVVDATNGVASQGTYGSNEEYALRPSADPITLGRSSTKQGTIAVTNAVNVGGQSHSNIQPTLACYYIIYIP